MYGYPQLRFCLFSPSIHVSYISLTGSILIIVEKLSTTSIAKEEEEVPKELSVEETAGPPEQPTDSFLAGYGHQQMNLTAWKMGRDGASEEEAENERKNTNQVATLAQRSGYLHTMSLYKQNSIMCLVTIINLLI